MSDPAGRFRGAVERGIRQGMNDYAEAHGLPYLRWAVVDQLSSGISLQAQASRGDYDDTERVRTAEMWAEHLHLERVVCAMLHAVEWRGQFDGIPIVLWAITNEEAWELEVIRLEQNAQDLFNQITKRQE